MAPDGAHSIGNLRPLLLLWLLDGTGRKVRMEPVKGVMHMNESQRCLDLRSRDDTEDYVFLSAWYMSREM